MLLWLLLAAAAPTAHGHGFVTSVRVQEATYPGAYTNASMLSSGLFTSDAVALRLAPPDKGWTVYPTYPEMACGSAGTPVAGAAPASLSIIGGDVVTVTITGAPSKAFFHWPCSIAIDMANCQADCATVDASTLQWFRIKGDGYVGNQWIMEQAQLATDYRTDGSGAGPEYYFIVPQDLASGNYMIRYETNCFWQAYDFQKVQPLAPAFPEFYPWCIQTTLRSNGTVSPPGQLITSYYTDADFSSLPAAENDTTALATWKLPGPAPVVFTTTPTANLDRYAANRTAYFAYQGSGWAAHGTATNHYSGDSATCSNDPAASFAFAFTGTGFTYYTSTASDRGAFRIFIDGSEVSGTAASAGAETAYTPVYAASNMLLGVHWINVTQDPSVTGTTPYLCNDMIQVQGSMLNATRLPSLFAANTNQRPHASDQGPAAGAPSGAPTGPNGGSKSNVGAIAGGVAGGVVALIALGVLLWWCRRRKRQHSYSTGSRRGEIMDQEDAMKYAAPEPYHVSVQSISAAPMLLNDHSMSESTPQSPIANSAIAHSVLSPPSGLSHNSSFSEHSDTSDNRMSMMSGLTDKSRMAEQEVMGAGSTSGARRTLPNAPLPTHEEDAGAFQETLPPTYETANRNRVSSQSTPQSPVV